MKIVNNETLHLIINLPSIKFSSVFEILVGNIYFFPETFKDIAQY